MLVDFEMDDEPPVNKYMPYTAIYPAVQLSTP